MITGNQRKMTTEPDNKPLAGDGPSTSDVPRHVYLGTSHQPNSMLEFSMSDLNDTLKRRFGVEIEFLFPTWENIQCIVNHGLPLWVDPSRIAVFGSTRQYNKNEDWKLTTDLSITNGDGTVGFEINSPILQGEAERQQLAQITNMLHHCGALIDKQCGLHVHIEIQPDFNQQQLKNLLKLQLNLEDSFDCPV
ncbi:MAG: hypothetical protein DRR08_19325 [Candidatus Parabeggiatoa sp. nov. 2]|nr:MAG: hypothetical protein B6247_12375 [Beggiatoa sp. 4572_84]RKZ57324.1 MAG: hypothetical protein DRR08_19325 [Gammaproteobacteria bacterium]